jgi:nitrogen regulatory protein PII
VKHEILQSGSHHEYYRLQRAARADPEAGCAWPFGFSENMKVEIYTTEEQAKTIAAELSSLADQLTEGGGVVAIEPVLQLTNVRKLDV